ncbi:DMT family transporter [Nisaea acidiphila]|uniref:DMT family transporter n=1 Tax=Nisaea acidiphila TaxID=1862145 RepID=A0A9J7AQ03_9PROT|nr:DMT family transporter [Nisaea acidiphila]UUX48986.1 DMT family transporter [Nisaea acidiphila]
MVSEPEKPSAPATGLLASTRSVFNRLSGILDTILKPVSAPFRALPGNARGAIWVVIAGLFFTVMTALIKSIGDTIPVVQILLFRQIVMTCTVMPILISGFPGILKTNHVPLHLARVLFAVIAMTCGFTAVVHLPLAEATALGFAKSLFVTIFALFLLSEVAGPRRWFAVLIGFAGVLVMVQPGPEGFNLYSVFAVAGAASAAAVMVIIRKVSQFDRSVTILSYQAILVGLIMIPPTIAYWVTPSPREWLVMAAIGVLSVFGQLSNIQGFKEGEASAVAPMDYTRLVFAALIGFIIFGEIPDIATAAGAGLIIATSLYTVRAEKRAAERKA